MYMEMTLTSENNVDTIYNRMIDESKSFIVVRDWKDIIDVFDTKDSTYKKVKVSNISLFNHRVVFGGDKYLIAWAYSK